MGLGLSEPSCSHETEDLWLTWWVVGWLCLVSMAGLVGNTLVLVSMACIPALRNPTYITIANLCGAGLLTCVFAVPVHLYNMLSCHGPVTPHPCLSNTNLHHNLSHTTNGLTINLTKYTGM